MVLIKKEKSQTTSVQRLARQAAQKAQERLQVDETGPIDDVVRVHKENHAKNVPHAALKKVLKKERADVSVVQKKALKKNKVPTLPQERVAELLNFVVHKLDEGKAEEIVTINLTGKTSFTDYLVIATGTSSRHVMGLMNNLVQDMKKAGYRARVSGDSGDGNWVVIDLIDVVVHLFTPETRSFYNLEDVWSQNA